LTVPFQIQWEDDDHEQNCILDQSSLNEAINFYHSGDEGSVASGSVFTSRNSSRYLRITMEVEICVGYDGPSLSDTASLASRDEYSPEESQISFSPGELSSSSQDDDAVTVSSKDMGSQQAPRQGRADSSLIKKLWNSTSRSGSSSTPNRPLLKPSRSRIFNLTSSRASTTQEGTVRSSTRDNMINGRNSGSLSDTERRYPDDPSAVFERLKLAEQRNPDYPHGSHQTEMKTWLQEQTTLQMRATLGVVPSISDDSFSLNTSSPFSDPGTDILLEKNENGRYYYTYTGSGSSESAGDLEYEVVNATQPGVSRCILRGCAVNSNFSSYSRRDGHPSRTSRARRGHGLLRMWTCSRSDQVHMREVRREAPHVSRCACRSRSRCRKGQESCLPRL
jgi:hypothetical protein